MTNVLGEFEYEYDQPAKGLSRLAKMTYPNGQETEFDWHPAAQFHRLAGITHRKGDDTLISSYGYAFAKGGQLRTWTQKVGADPLEHWQIEHDEAEQLRSVVAREGGPTGSILRQQFYNYDPAGNRTGYQDGHSVRALAYNHLNQIVSQPSGGPIRFEGTINEPGTVSINDQPAALRTVLDENEAPAFRFAADIPLSAGLNQVTVEAVDASSNPATELYEVTVTDGSTGVPPVYDTRGNMVSNGRGQSYEWDALNRLLAISYADDTRTEFTYDALSRRIRVLEKDDEGEIVTDKRLLWEGTNIVQERDDQNQVIKRYTTHGLALADNSTYFYTRDHLGSIRQVTDEDEIVAEHYSYDPYGDQTASAPGGPNNLRLADFRYTGHYHHEKSNLHLAMYRAYDSELGRWISEDPLEEEGGINLYGYVENEPVKGTDPLGLSPGGFRGRAFLRAQVKDKKQCDRMINEFNELWDEGQQYGLAVVGGVLAAGAAATTGGMAIVATAETSAGAAAGTYITNNIFRWGTRAVYREGKKMVEKGLHCHIGPKELMKHHLPYQWKTWMHHAKGKLTRWWSSLW